MDVGHKRRRGIKNEARVLSLSYRIDGTAINQDGKIVSESELMHNGGRVHRALLGLVVFKKPIQHLSGDSAEASGYSRVEFRGEAQGVEINSEVSRSMWMGLEL